MTTVLASFDLSACLARLSQRNPGRTEADIQADVRDVLLYGGFDIGDENVLLESPAPGQRRIDVEVGRLDIECKRDLRPNRTRQEAEEQLEGYLRSREQGAPGTYIGILTDGVLWRHYQTDDSSIAFVSEYTVSSNRVDERKFRTWLGSLLATERELAPTGAAIGERLGSNSPGFRAALTILRTRWEHARHVPEVELKRALWGKMLRTAFGTQFNDTEDLFLEHTYLVLVATLIAHLVLGYEADELQQSPQVALSGGMFSRMNIRGVGEAGFFDWVIDVENGESFISDLLRRLSVFNWSEIDHDVLKELYESVIGEETRHRLGEYYTPDWLAKRIVEHTVVNPLSSRVLDPSCGSGTFLFHAVRHYLDEAERSGVSTDQAIGGVVQHVFGMDVHPVAISLAQVTYLLAIGAERMRARTTGEPISIPVYLGDSMRWEATKESLFAPSGDIVIQTDTGALFQESTALRFPGSVLDDASKFDALVDEMARMATDRARGSNARPIDGLLRQFSIVERDQPVLRATYHQMCRLHDEERDHIWSFYVRNQARPTWFAMAENRMDVLVGNPPWLSYRHMPPEMQDRFRAESRERGIWAGGRVATQQDLSAYFVARSIELYLEVGGSFAFVMPRAALNRKAYEGFRRGEYVSKEGDCFVMFTTPWDLDGVKPIPFPVPSSVISGQRVERKRYFSTERGLPELRLRALGTLEGHKGNDAGDGLTWEEVDPTQNGPSYTSTNSPYSERFKQGAVLVPRMLLLVNVEPPHPMQPKTLLRVRSRRGRLDKVPWRNLEDHTGLVESVFVRPVYLGEHCLPFRMLPPAKGVIPFDGRRVLSDNDERLDRYKGLSQWWRQNERTWRENRSKASNLSLTENIDYFAKLSSQFPLAGLRVVYTKAGSNLTAAIIRDSHAVIDHQLYWGVAQSEEEAHYLAAILNAPHLGRLVEPYQPRGAFGTRHFDKYVWYPPIPVFDVANESHARLAELGEEAALRAADFPLNERITFQRARAQLREELTRTRVLEQIDELVYGILARKVGH